MKDVSKFAEVFEFVSASISGIMEKGGTQAVQLPTSVATGITVDLSI